MMRNITFFLLICSSLNCLAQSVNVQLPYIHPGPYYGRNCGLIGIDADKRITIETLIHYRDTATIVDWLGSNKTEIQAYAIEAIIRLQEIGAINPTFHQMEINNILMKHAKVYVCIGFSHWPTTLKDALKPGISINKISSSN